MSSVFCDGSKCVFDFLPTIQVKDCLSFYISFNLRKE